MLDELTNELDPEELVVACNYLLEMAKDGTTIFISSHLLDEMEKLVSRIGILAHGCLLGKLNFSEFETCREFKFYIKTDGSVNNFAHYLATKTCNAHK